MTTYRKLINVYNKINYTFNIVRQWICLGYFKGLMQETKRLVSILPTLQQKRCNKQGFLSKTGWIL